MIVILITGLAMAGAAVVLLGRGLVMSRARAVETLRTIDGYGFAGHGASETAEKSRTIVSELATRLGGLLGQFIGASAEAQLRTRLLAAGLYKTHPRDFVGYRVLSALAFGAFSWWFASMSGRGVVAAVLVGFGGVAAGWVLPLYLLKRKAARRLTQIDYDLPELVDLLVVTVEAGLGFNASLQTASERLGGPLGDELRLSLQEQRMGLSGSEALKNMLERCETPAMRSFVRSTLQGESLGVSIGEILRNLAREMRIRRRQAAEERAQKAPTKLLFPLVLLIFPAMFVVIVGPAGFAFMDAF